MAPSRDILKRLNPVQREAVLHHEGPLLILAGAGSGKTRVLTHRIAYLIGERGVPPSRILAVTFTNKAAGEMKERVERLVGAAVANMWIGTFHAMCARVLRTEAHHIGYTPRFVVYDTDDQRSVLKLMLKELGISDRDYPVGMVQARISKAKNALIGPEEFSDQAAGFRDQAIARIFQRYQAALRANNAFDFDDLLTHPIELFQKHPPILEHYQTLFQHILIDEYQDTNHAQYVLVNTLAARHRNLCVVGDDDQSIYGFRGADIRNILDFERDYPDAKVIRLEQNYRSTQTILQAANGVVKNNRGRKPKKLWTENQAGDQLVMLEGLDERHEAHRIVDVIRDKDRTLSDFVILYRTNAQSRALEDELRRAGIPYVIVGGLRFYERKEIKDVLAYLRLISNPYDSVSLRRIINLPRRGVGQKTMQALEDVAASGNKRLFEAVGSAGQLDIPPSTQKNLKAFADMIQTFGEYKSDLSIAELTRELLAQIGYFDVLARESPVEAQIRQDNVKELVSAMADFADEAEDPSLDAFLEKVSLITDVDQWKGDSDAVTLMTLHCAKGLEFPVVFICGLEEGLFPLSNAAQEQDGLEEERRLFYVGITRAQQDLLLTHARQRRQYGTTRAAVASRFLREIPGELLKHETLERASGWTQQGSTDLAPGSEEAVVDYAAYDDVAPDEILFKVGRHVVHPTFGRGQILERTGAGENTRFLIAFENGLKKKVIAKYAHLRPS